MILSSRSFADIHSMLTPPSDSDFVHAGREDFRSLGVHAPPLDLSTTYPVEELGEASEDIDAMLTGARARHSPIYARLASPTVDRFERALAQLESGGDAGAFGSGQARATVGEQVRADAVLVIIETPATPTLTLVDIADVARQAGRVPLLV